MFKSFDGGEHWDRMGLANVLVWQVVLDPATSTMAYAVTTNLPEHRQWPDLE